MIITKDMLEAKGFSFHTLEDFLRYFPNGFDFSKPHKYFFVLGYNGGTALQENDLAYLFAYTGISITKDVYVSGNVPNYTIMKYNYVNGLLENFPNGDPAVACMYKGTPDFVRFYSNGVLHNPSNKLPACISWWENGNIRSYFFYENGVENDPFPGVPAYTTYYPDGVNKCCIRSFGEGQLLSEARYESDGTLISIGYP